VALSIVPFACCGIGGRVAALFCYGGLVIQPKFNWGIRDLEADLEADFGCSTLAGFGSGQDAHCACRCPGTESISTRFPPSGVIETSIGDEVLVPSLVNYHNFVTAMSMEAYQHFLINGNLYGWVTRSVLTYTPEPSVFVPVYVAPPEPSQRYMARLRRNPWKNDSREQPLP